MKEKIVTNSEISLQKRFKALAFVWLLFCLFATSYYVDDHDLEGLFMRLFVYGVFAAPVWINYGWIYLFGEKPITVNAIISISIIYFIWLWSETKERTDSQVLVLVSWAYLLTVAGKLGFVSRWVNIAYRVIVGDPDSKSGNEHE